jgi:proline iminopeptidase
MARRGRGWRGGKCNLERVMTLIRGSVMSYVRVGLTFMVVAIGLGASTALEGQNPDVWWVMPDDGCSLFVQEIGEGGGPWVLIHGGWGAEHSYLRDLVEGLETSYRLVFYDQRGSLRSPYRVYESGGSRACPDSLISVDHHIEDLDRLRSQLGLERLNLIAHSMGGFLALSYLERYPERVEGLVLIATTEVKSDDPDITQSRREAAVMTLLSRPELGRIVEEEGLGREDLTDRERIHEWRIRFAAVSLWDISKWRELTGGMAFHNSRAGNAASRSAPKTWDFTDALRAHPYQITMIRGTWDFIDLNGELHNRWLDGLDHVELVLLDNAGHNPWVDQPAEVRSALKTALARFQ